MYPQKSLYLSNRCDIMIYLETFALCKRNWKQKWCLKKNNVKTKRLWQCKVGCCELARMNTFIYLKLHTESLLSTQTTRDMNLETFHDFLTNFRFSYSSEFLVSLQLRADSYEVKANLKEEKDENGGDTDNLLTLLKNKPQPTQKRNVWQDRDQNAF